MNSYIKWIQLINEFIYDMFCTLLLQYFLVQYHHPLINQVNVCTVEHNIIEPMNNTKLQDTCNMIKN